MIDKFFSCMFFQYLTDSREYLDVYRTNGKVFIELSKKTSMEL
jgi:hypothetical protein